MIEEKYMIEGTEPQALKQNLIDPELIFMQLKDLRLLYYLGKVKKDEMEYLDFALFVGAGQHYKHIYMKKELFTKETDIFYEELLESRSLLYHVIEKKAYPLSINSLQSLCRKVNIQFDPEITLTQNLYISEKLSMTNKICACVTFLEFGKHKIFYFGSDRYNLIPLDFIKILVELSKGTVKRWQITHNRTFVDILFPGETEYGLHIETSNTGIIPFIAYPALLTADSFIVLDEGYKYEFLHKGIIQDPEVKLRNIIKESKKQIKKKKQEMQDKSLAMLPQDPKKILQYAQDKYPVYCRKAGKKHILHVLEKESKKIVNDADLVKIIGNMNYTHDSTLNTLAFQKSKLSLWA